MNQFIDWTAMRESAQQIQEQLESNYWRGLYSLRDIFDEDDLRTPGDWKYTNDQIIEDPDLMPIAVRYCRDIVRFKALHVQSPFMASVVRQLTAENGSLTNGQARGVLNVLGGGIKYNRGRFWKSRGRRRDRFSGDENCLVCGGPLTTDEAVSRALGDTCYRRVMGLR